MKQVKMFNQRNLYQPTNPNQWYCCTTQKWAIGLTSTSQNHFVKSFAHIADSFNSA